MVCSTSQSSGFCMVWVFTVENIQTDYHFCCFNINELSFYVIFRLHDRLISSLLRCPLVLISGGGYL